MAGQIRGRQILPASNQNVKGDFGYHPAAATTKWDILYCTGVRGGTLELTDADAGAAATCTGPLFVAMHDADPIASRPTDPVARANPGPVLVGPVDTSAASGSGAVYLSDTAGEFAFSAGPVTRVVGVVVVNDASNGYWLFDGRLGTLPA